MKESNNFVAFGFRKLVKHPEFRQKQQQIKQQVIQEHQLELDQSAFSNAG